MVLRFKRGFKSNSLILDYLTFLYHAIKNKFSFFLDEILVLERSEWMSGLDDIK